MTVGVNMVIIQHMNTLSVMHTLSACSTYMGIMQQLDTSTLHCSGYGISVVGDRSGKIWVYTH